MFLWYPLPRSPAIYWSGNWAGPQIITPRRVLTQASTQFRVPTVSAQGPAWAEMSYWVGLGGKNAPMNLCQAGVADTRLPNGTLQAGLITEDWPTPPAVKTIVQPGDWITARVGLIQGRYQATVDDMTRHQSLTVGCRRPWGAWTRAEWIAESKVRENGQPVLVSQSLQFQHMAVQRRAWSPLWCRLFMGPATWPATPRRGTALITFF